MKRFFFLFQGVHCSSADDCYLFRNMLIMLPAYRLVQRDGVPASSKKQYHPSHRDLRHLYGVGSMEWPNTIWI